MGSVVMVVHVVHPGVATQSELLQGTEDVEHGNPGETGCGLDDWTLSTSLQTQNSFDAGFHDVLHSVEQSTADVNGIFGEYCEPEFPVEDPYAASASAEPSVARTSELGQDDRFLSETKQSVELSGNDVVDTATALEVAARSIPAQPLEPRTGMGAGSLGSDLWEQTSF